MGEVAAEGVGLDAEIAEHSIRAPTPQKLGSVGVNVGAEKCGSTTRAKRPGRDEMREDAGVLLDVLGGMTKGICDERRCDFIPVVVGCIEVVVKRCVGRGVVLLKMEAEVAEGFTGTEERVVGGCLAQTLTLHAILLSANSRVACVIWSIVASFKGAEGASYTRPLMVR